MGTNAGEGGRRRAPRAALAATVLLLAMGAPLATAQSATGQEQGKEFDFEVAPDSLGDALTTFGMQSGLQVSFAPELVEGKRSAGLSGRFTAAAGLDELLRETGLEYGFINGSTVVIRRAQPPSATVETAAGTLTGRVTQAGEPVAGATVTATSEALEEPRVVTTDEEGKYELTDLPPGKYSLRFELEGLVPVVKEAEVSPGESTTLDTQMSLHEVREDIVVTGTRIRGIAPDSSPLTTYTREDIDRSGVATVEQFVRKMPANFAAVDASTPGQTNAGGGINQLGGNSFAGAGINLRGLGPEATLVLINGDRVSPAGSSGSFVDISQIPLSAVDRIEVLTDGASALYGADAAAGVVNFVLREDFDGAETTLRYGSATQGGAGDLTASQLLGKSWAGGNGLLVLEYNDQEGLLSSERTDFIPDQGLPVNVLPGQERGSVVLTGQQEIFRDTMVKADVHYSDRDYADAGAVDIGTGPLREQFRGQATQYGALLGASHNFGDDWRARVSGNYSKVEQSQTTVSLARPGPPVEVEGDTELAGVELLLDGSAFSAPGGDARIAVGSSWRTEELQSFASVDQNLTRDVTSAFGELFVPLIGETNAKRWTHRFELSLAARYDDYSDVGSSTNPKFGVLWSPTPSLSLRSTYGTSFRPPRFPQLSPVRDFCCFTFDIPDETAPDGLTTTLFLQPVGNPDLRPEESDSFTAGFDFRPRNTPGLSIAATYFRTTFEGRIARPPIVGGNIFLIFLQREALAPFIDSMPDPGAVKDVFESPGFAGDFAGHGPEGVEVVYNNSLLNLASTNESGIEFSTNYALETEHGNVGFFVAGTYLFDLDFQSFSTVPVVSLLNTLSQPMDFRLHSGFHWSGRRFGAALTVNYWDNYKNDFFTPPQRIDSWTTGDLNLSYRLSSEAAGPLRHLTVVLSAQNITDEDPPFVAAAPTAFFNVGYDAANASPVGRVVALELRIPWKL